MRREDIFDKVHTRVKECRLQMLQAGSSFPDGKPHGGGPPTVGNRAAEYVGDFALAGRRALFLWPQKLEVFRRYYVCGEPLRKLTPAVEAGQAAKGKLQLGPLIVAEGTFWRWTKEIKRQVAPELVRRGLFPPRLYSHKPTPTEDESQYTNSLWADVLEVRR